MDLPSALGPLAESQLGVLSRRQLVDAGVSVDGIRWQLGRHWRMVLPGVLLLHMGLPTDEQRLVAAQLYAGPRAWLAGPTAAAVHGILDRPDLRRVHMLVPAPARPRDVAWLSVRRTHLTDEYIVDRGPLRLSCRPRAVVDAAALSPDPVQARAVIVSAVQRRLVRIDDVHHWVEARRPNGRLVLRQAVLEAAQGFWSVPEADLGRILATSRLLPEVWANPELVDAQGRRLTTPDLWMDDVAMAVMVHSRRYHAGDLDWDATVETDTDLSSERVVVVGVTPGAIERDPSGVLRRVESSYRSARESGFRPAVVATPRHLVGGLRARARPLRSGAVSAGHVARHVASEGVCTPPGAT